ncbi:zona pellucida sperm-binding protein 4-like [Rhinatrema bivittatum]|uniref:zona pellucida sperm-binding protein 4-like n=1 Tax=Rhinatrema bivittatum TaxID=194408 RepID=UPI00112BC242|nr:zona pellucida sperm-binding protein 4-like [Rhinatrema bivittatum]
MGGLGTGCIMVGQLLAVWFLLPAIGVGDFTGTDFIGDPSQLNCGYKSLQLTLPHGQDENTFMLVALDKEQKPHFLHNDSVCGTWTGQKPDGSLTIGAAYNSCYVTEQNGEHVMTIGIADITGQNVVLKEALKCPILPAQDAPSPGVCAAVKKGDKLSCASPPVTQDLCQGKGCCYNPSDPSIPCYFGDLITAQCTKDGKISIAVSKYRTLPPLILNSVRLLSVQEGTCSELSTKKNDVFIMYEFPLSCGSTIWLDGDHVVYENRLEATNDVRTWQDASITRDSIFRLTVRCSFTASSFLPLQVEVFTLPPPPSVNSSGPLLLEMRIAKDVQYSSYYLNTDYPVTKFLRDPVYLEVRILQRTDPNLVLVLNQCWATPLTDPLQKPQWPILVNSCPFTGDNYRTQQIPVGAVSTGLQFPSHYQRFVVKTFTFVDGSQHALKGLVYFHCSASVCVRSRLETCSTTCLPARKKRMTKHWEPLTSLVTAEGPVDFHSSKSLEKTESQTDAQLNWARGAVATVAAFGITSAAAVVVWKFYKAQKCETNVKV